MSKQMLTREERAQQLLSEGRVRLFPGRGYAEVIGSKGDVYTVTKQGCNCPSSLSRDARYCYHALAVKAACAEYRHLAKLARAGETVRPSASLLLALGWRVGEQSPACPAHGEPLPCSWCEWETFERDLATRCMTCGERLTVDGRCPRRAERMAA